MSFVLCCFQTYGIPNNSEKRNGDSIEVEGGSTCARLEGLLLHLALVVFVILQTSSSQCVCENACAGCLLLFFWKRCPTKLSIGEAFKACSRNGAPEGGLATYDLEHSI